MNKVGNNVSFNFLLCILCFSGNACRIIEAEDDDHYRFAAPEYVFELGGLPEKAIEQIRKVPGVIDTSSKADRIKIKWKHFKDDLPWSDDKKWIDGAETLFDFIAVKENVGKTKFLGGGYINSASGRIISETRGEITFGVKFWDQITRSNETMRIECYNEAAPGQLEHEMLRNVPGTNVSVEQCGDGYVIVSRGGRGTFVVWKVSDQIFVRIDNSFDKEFVSTYVKRLGSTIPSNFKVDEQSWLEDEIRWRILQLKKVYAMELRSHKSLVRLYVPFVVSAFPESRKIVGDLKVGDSAQTVWIWLDKCILFLWANRKNFKYDDKSRGFILKDRNLAFPDHIEDLPEDLKCPPKPPSGDGEQNEQKTEVLKKDSDVHEFPLKTK